MAFKFVVFFAALACANAGFLGAPAAVSYSAAPAVSHVSYASPVVSYGSAAQVPAITSQHQNILRTPGNLAQVSTYSKTIDTPFSSVSKSDVRVSNPGYVSTLHAAPVATYAAAAPVVHAAPVATYAAPAPVVRTYAAPAPAVAVARAAAPALLGVAYSAAPAVSHMTYSNGFGLTYGW